jgi:hypothetical protein
MVESQSSVARAMKRSGQSICPGFPTHSNLATDCTRACRRLHSPTMGDQRRYPRYLFGGVGQLLELPGGPASEVTIPAINMAGCGANGRSIPAVGQKCELVIKWEAKQFCCDVEVKWKTPRGDAGLKFLSMDDERHAILRTLFATLHLEPVPTLPSRGHAKKAKPARPRERKI